tara:strand:- start:7876 stop:10248 length:2373 start_codon:yes stop_codon:yes gene_type:complete
MAQKVYKRIGLRRSRNLSDLSNSSEALNNMLEDLAAGGVAGETFIGEDLDAIKNSYSEGLEHSDYVQVGGSAVKFWDNATNDTKTYLPYITYQNRLDQFEIFAGDPRLQGGNGLTASYYQFNQVFENNINNEGVVLGGNANVIGIFSGAPFKVDNFWERGDFHWDRKLHPSSINVNGGIEYEGYIVPFETGPHRFWIQSSGNVSFDFQTEGYEEDDQGNIISSGIATYTELAKIGIGSTASASVNNWGSGNNQIVLSDTSLVKHIAIGQIVTHSNIASDVLVDTVNRSNGVIQLTAPTSGDAITGNFSNQNVVFTKDVDTVIRTEHVTSYSLQKFKRYRIKFRYFIPQIHDTSSISRYLDIEWRGPSGQFRDLRFTSLYPIDYDFSEAAKGDMNLFLDNSVLFGGNTNSTGIGSETDYLNYVTVKTGNKVDVKYDPRNITTSSVVKRSLTSQATTNNSTVLSNDNTSNIEVGQYVYDTTNITGTRVIPDGTRVIEIVINEAIILSNPATSSSSINIDFVDHRGHVQRVIGQSNGTSQIDFNSDYATNESTMRGRLIIGGNNVNNTKIDSILDSDTIGLSTAMSSTTGSNQTYYIYESQGIINNSLAGFCDNDTKCVMVRGTSNVVAGSVTIPVRDADSVVTGDRVLGYYFFDKTTVTSKVSNGVNGGGTAGENSNHSITIAVDGNTSTGTEKLIKPGNNFTTTSKPDGDRALCCPPKDTSPPFEATDDGMQTTSARSNLQLTTGDLKFDAFGATGITATTPTNIEALGNEESESRIRIHTPSGVFKLLTT